MSDVYNSQLDAFALYHLYSESRRSNESGAGVAIPALGHALAGAVGSAISNVSVYPLDLIVTRLQSQRQLSKNSSLSAQRYNSIPDAFRKIVSDEGGVAALYAGLFEDTAKTVADAFLFFLAYNAVRNSRAFKRDGGSGESLSVLSELSVGFVAGAFSKLLTAPIANVVTRLQTSSMAGGRKLTATDVARQIRDEKGLLGFWSGYSASLVLTLNPSLTFFFFETFKKATLKAGKDGKAQQPGALATFLLAATSKALASTVTYPFSLAKARIQVSSKGPDSAEEKSGEKGNTPSSAAKRAASARKDTVFSTIARIASSEGPQALYEGLSGEVLKGFVNHGLTMMTKDIVHRLVISLYFAILRLLKRHPEVQAAVEDAAHTAQNAVDNAKEGVESVRNKVEEIRKDASGVVENAVENVLEKTKMSK